MGIEVLHSTGAVSFVGKAGAVKEKTGASTEQRCNWSGLDARISVYREQLLPIVADDALELGSFTLSSGQVSDYYIDGKQVTLSSEGALLFARIVLEALRDQQVDAVGGRTVGADPIAGSVVLLSAIENQPLRGFIVRKEAKRHGKMAHVEGPLRNGDRVVIVDDVITTGASVLKTIKTVEEFAEVVGVLALVDREQGGKQVLEDKGYPTYAVFTASELKRVKRCREASST